MSANQIYNNNELYRFLLLYFYDDLSAPALYDEIMVSKNQRQTICGFFEEWIPWDTKVQELIKQKFAGEP